MSIRIFLTKTEGITITQDLNAEHVASINELGCPEYEVAQPEVWAHTVCPISELTPEEVRLVFDTIREILEARL